MKTWHKNKILVVFILTVGINHLAFADDDRILFRRTDGANPTKELMKKNSELMLAEENNIATKRSELDFDAVDYYSGNDVSRVNVTYGVAPQGLSSYELTASGRINDYAKHWWVAGVRSMSSQFSGITTNHPVSTSASVNSEASSTRQRPDGSKTSMTALMVGYGHRFHFVFGNLFNAPNLFETVNVFFTYNTLKDSFTSESYKGPGLSAEYDVHKRSGRSFYYGLKFAYHYAVVTRSAIGKESRSDRSLSLGWANLGLHFGFYY